METVLNKRYSFYNVEYQNTESLGRNDCLNIWHCRDEANKASNKGNDCLNHSLEVIGTIHAQRGSVGHLVLDEPASHIQGVSIKRKNTEFHETDHNSVGF